jgi:organic radical activating enzyme
MKAKISEIFESIQGEGLYQGQKQIFVRFYGCNLNCSYCDTRLNYYQEKTVEEVSDDVFYYRKTRCVSLTGGEPLLQIDFLQNLTKRLKSEGKALYLETNGTLCQNLRKVISDIDIVAMDFKLPSSTSLRGFWQEHENFLKICLKNNKEIFIKIVIGENSKFNDIIKTIGILKKFGCRPPVVLQPQSPFEDFLGEKLESFARLFKRNSLDVRIIAQIHKKLGIP